MGNQNSLWLKTLLDSTATIERVIETLNSSTLKIVLIKDGANKLIGTITDGDIRRGLLQGLDLNSPIDSIINKKPLVVTSEVHRKEILGLMAKRRIQQIPIVNSENEVVGMHLWDELENSSPHPNTFVVMAGGVGSRLYPHTKDCPKPLLPVGGKPILQHILERAKDEGFSDFVLSINYLGHMIEEYFGDGKNFGVTINYLREEVPLGTAGSLSLFDSPPESPIVVVNGDSITNVGYSNMLDFHLENDASATIAVKTHEWQNPYGVVQTDGSRILDIEEKPIIQSKINAGSYVLSPSVLHLLEKDSHCDMTTLLKRAQAQKNRLIAFPVYESWIDFTTADDLKSRIFDNKDKIDFN
jgi:dTDP-glucose pyrophosphorylase